MPKKGKKAPAFWIGRPPQPYHLRGLIKVYDMFWTSCVCGTNSRDLTPIFLPSFPFIGTFFMEQLKTLHCHVSRDAKISDDWKGISLFPLLFCAIHSNFYPLVSMVNVYPSVLLYTMYLYCYYIVYTVA